MLNRYAWIIPVNTTVLFALLCFWAIQKHDTLWAVIDSIFALVNAFFAYRWLRMRRAPKPPRPNAARR